MGRVSPVEGLHNLLQVDAKGQVTVPQAIRAAWLQHGDVLGWELDKQSVRKKLVSSVALNHLCGVEASLSEWASAADEAAFSGL